MQMQDLKELGGHPMEMDVTNDTDIQQVVYSFIRFWIVISKVGNSQKQRYPLVEYFSDKIHLSGNYLSDLLKKETGYTITDHVNNF